MNDRQLLKRKVAALNETEILEVIEYITIMESLREEARTSDLFADAHISSQIERKFKLFDHAGISGTKSGLWFLNASLRTEE